MMSLQKAATGITSGTFFLSMTSCVMMHTEANERWFYATILLSLKTALLVLCKTQAPIWLA